MEGEAHGHSTDAAELAVSLVKPIILPYWKFDLSAIVQTRLRGVEFNLEMSTTDMFFPATHAPPFGDCAISIPTGSDLSTLLQPYNPKTHLQVFEDSDVEKGESAPDVIPISFTLFPDTVPATLTKALPAIRDEEVRFTGEIEIPLFAAYPIYAPFFLADFRNRKSQKADDIVRYYTIWRL